MRRIIIAFLCSGKGACRIIGFCADQEKNGARSLSFGGDQGKGGAGSLTTSICFDQGRKG